MKFAAPTNKIAPGRRGYESAFTLVEVLAALMFMAIVIPVAIQALHVASLSGEVAARKGEAASVADRVLNEAVVTGNLGQQNGTVTEGGREFRWTVHSDVWPVDAMQLMTADVTYTAQGREYSVRLSTLTPSQSVLSQ
jgi:type II secretory pathway pseudopilin PulG